MSYVIIPSPPPFSLIFNTPIDPFRPSQRKLYVRRTSLGPNLLLLDSKRVSPSRRSVKNPTLGERCDSHEDPIRHRMITTDNTSVVPRVRMWSRWTISWVPDTSWNSFSTDTPE